MHSHDAVQQQKPLGYVFLSIRPTDETDQVYATELHGRTNAARLPNCRSLDAEHIALLRRRHSLDA